MTARMSSSRKMSSSLPSTLISVPDQGEKITRSPSWTWQWTRTPWAASRPSPTERTRPRGGLAAHGLFDSRGGCMNATDGIETTSDQDVALVSPRRMRIDPSHDADAADAGAAIVNESFECLEPVGATAAVPLDELEVVQPT